MLNVILQTLPFDFNTMISPLLSIIGTIIVILSFGRMIAVGRKTELDKKLDKEEFKEYKIETNTRIRHKVDEKLFDVSIRDIEEEMRANQKASDQGFRLLRETLEKTCATQASTNEIVSKMVVHIEYIIKSIDEQKNARHDARKRGGNGL